jgi:Condensation domain
VIARHEILRTVFPVKDGNPVQVILPFLEINIPVVSLGDVSELSREDKTRELALVEPRRPFDLRAGPLLRAKVLDLADQKFFLLLNVDHMILDGLSMAVLFNEIATCYDAFLDGQSRRWDPLPVQYADYAFWQRERFLDQWLAPYN